MTILYTAIQTALQAAEGVTDRAVPILITADRKSPKLYRELCDTYLEGICRDLCNAANRQRRSGVAAKADNPETAHEPPLPRKDGRIKPPADAGLRSYGSSVLMFFQLPGGLYLKDATGFDLDAAIEHYTKQARTETQRASFLAMVRQGVKDRQRVETAFDESALNTLWRKAS